jgi:hypothetical protein
MICSFFPRVYWQKVTIEESHGNLSMLPEVDSYNPHFIDEFLRSISVYCRQTFR